MRADKRRKKINRVKFILIMTVLILFFAYLEASMRTLVREICVRQANLIGTQIINTAVDNVLKESQTDYDKLVEVKYSESVPCAVEVKSMEINRLRAQVSEEITAELKALEVMDLDIAIGSLLNSDLLTARGPKLKLKIKPNGILNTKIISEFDEAGINQTRHRIVINITVDVSCTLPFYKNSAKINSELVAAETVIVGLVPEYYTKVVSEDEKVISKLNDYTPNKNSLRIK